MRILSIPPLSRLSSLAPVILRVIVGVVFVAHGVDKFADGPPEFAEMLAGLGVPVSLVVAWLVAIAELVGGILLIVGLLTRLATMPLMAIMVGAIALVKVEMGLIAEEGAGAELDLALLAGLLAVLLLGPGKPSLDHVLGIEQGVPGDTGARRHRPIGA